MHVHIITLFPEALSGYLDSSIVGRARRRGLLHVDLVDPRRWAGGRHRRVDDRPFGGGPGMVLMAPPLAGAIDWCLTTSACPRLLTTSPQGRPLDQAWAAELATEQHLILLCGHYEGIDQRIDDLYHPEPFSIGDYVLSGGELPALVLIDAVTRLLPDALGNADSAVEDSFANAEGGFDHPSWTRPREFRGLQPPEELMSGDHAAVARWREDERRRRTTAKRG